jgi:hypothetical protein
VRVKYGSNNLVSIFLIDFRSRVTAQRLQIQVAGLSDRARKVALTGVGFPRGGLTTPRVPANLFRLRCRQIFEQTPQGFAAVADVEFRRAVDFAKRAIERRVEEKRVVAEAASTARFVDDLTFYFAAEYPAHSAALGKRDDADKSRGAV